MLDSFTYVPYTNETGYIVHPHFMRWRTTSGRASDRLGPRREHGDRDALAAHGLTADPALHGAGDFSEQSGEAAIRERLARGAAFSAVFAADDEMAIGAMN